MENAGLAITFLASQSGKGRSAKSKLGFTSPLAKKLPAKSCRSPKWLTTQTSRGLAAKFTF